MDHFEINEILQTFQIIADTREQNTPRASERFKSFGVPVCRATLNYGDYCGNIALPSGSLYDTNSRISASCCVERKMSLDELAGCFTRSRERFKREFARASEHGAKIYLLVENASWEAIQNHRYRSRYNEKAFEASLVAWSVRYNITAIFCKAETSGELIKEVLYRDMKERLEKGEFDNVELLRQ